MHNPRYFKQSSMGPHEACCHRHMPCSTGAAAGEPCQQRAVSVVSAGEPSSAVWAVQLPSLCLAIATWCKCWLSTHHRVHGHDYHDASWSCSGATSMPAHMS